MSNDAANAKVILKKCVSLSKAQRWRRLLITTENDKSFLLFPRILIYKLDAAVALGHFSLIKAIVEEAKTVAGFPDETFAIVREINRYGFTEQATALLLEKSDLKDDVAFVPSIRRLLKATADPELRKKLTDALDTATRGGASIAPVRSEHAFPDRVNAVPAGEVRLFHATTVGRRHIDRLNADTAAFRDRIADPNNARVGEYHDVFVDCWGQIWNEDGAVIHSVGMPTPPLKRTDVTQADTAMHALSKTRGIYHFLVDRLPMFAWMHGNAAASSIPILLRSGAPTFERQLLELGDFPTTQIMEVSEPIFVRRLIRVRCGFEGLVGWQHVAPLFDQIIDNSLKLAAQHDVKLPEKIYISRALAARRQMANEHDVHEAMQSRNIAVYQFENIPLWHQVALSHSAKTIVGPHGAGLSHLMFAPSATKIIEILPIADGTYTLRWNFSRLAQVRGQNYVAWLEEQPLPVSDRWTTTTDQFLPFLDAELAD